MNEFQNPREAGKDAYARGDSRYSSGGGWSNVDEYEFRQGWDEAERAHLDDIESARYVSELEYSWWQEHERHDDEEDWGD